MDRPLKLQIMQVARSKNATIRCVMRDNQAFVALFGSYFSQ